MDIRRATFEVAVRLAVMFSAAAAGLALVLDATGDVSPVAFVSAVVIVGFVTSWVVTGRVAKSIVVVSRR
jgi:hypothetical protein